MVTVNDKMQQGYEYELTAKEGELPSNFSPRVTPKQMLEMGVFGGLYMCDCSDEFPEWFDNAKLSPNYRDARLNYFGIDASQSLDVWRSKGWVTEQDPRGWFQWYCRFYAGRRCEGDLHQIKRWRQMSRHLGQILANCDVSDCSCRPKQRQALLHWGVLVDGSYSGEHLRKLFKKE